jgi:hypothetical protein
MTEKLVPPLSPAGPITGTGHANGEIADKLTRISAAEQAEREIRGEMSRLADANAASSPSGQKRRARGRLRRPRRSLRRSGWPTPRRGRQGKRAYCRARRRIAVTECPTTPCRPDFAPVSSALARLLRGDPFWPGGRRTAYESWSAERGRAGKNTASKLSNAEAVARFPGETA